MKLKLLDFKVGDKVMFIRNCADRPTATQICCGVPWWKISKGTIGKVTWIYKDSIGVEVDRKFDCLAENIKDGETGSVLIYEKKYCDSISLEYIRKISKTTR